MTLHSNQTAAQWCGEGREREKRVSVFLILPLKIAKELERLYGERVLLFLSLFYAPLVFLSLLFASLSPLSLRISLPYPPPSPPKVDLQTVMLNYEEATVVFASRYLQPTAEAYSRENGFHFIGPQICLRWRGRGGQSGNMRREREGKRGRLLLYECP